MSALAFSGDGRRFAVAFRDGRSQLFDSAEFEPIGPAVFQARAVSQLFVSETGDSWTTVLTDGAARTWIAPTPQSGSSDGISLALEVDTGLQLDSNQMGVELPTPAWRERKEQFERTPNSEDYAARASLSVSRWHEARARDAEELGNWHTARRHLLALAERSPDNWIYQARLARTHSSLDEYDAAQTFYDAASAKLGKEQQSRLITWLNHRSHRAAQDGKNLRAIWYAEQIAPRAQGVTVE